MTAQEEKELTLYKQELIKDLTKHSLYNIILDLNVRQDKILDFEYSEKNTNILCRTIKAMQDFIQECIYNLDDINIKEV